MKLAERRLAPVMLSFVLGLGACGGGGGGSPTSPTPSSPSADATIGPTGGTLTGAGGAVRLVVPAGALATNVGLSVRTSNRGPLDPHAVFRTAYEIAPAGTTFAVPATLVLRFDPSRGPSGTEESDWRAAVLDAGGAWQPMAGTTDAGSHEATASRVLSTGVFGVVWPGPRGSCGSPEDHQFDFWLGSWAYHQGNLPPASNEITREGGGCLIEEHFQDPAGVQGRSVSLFSRRDGQWHQTYIDSQGTFFALAGALQGPRMVLNQDASHRFTWEPLDVNTIRYFGERSTDGGNTWSTSLDARYTRR